MNDTSFNEIKRDTEKMIEKIKTIDAEKGVYLEQHIIFDDKNETMSYTGDPEIIADILSKAIS